MNAIAFDERRALACADRQQVVNCRAKTKYATEGSAIFAAGAVITIKENRNKHLALRCYRCPVCGFWHMSKKVGHR